MPSSISVSSASSFTSLTLWPISSTTIAAVSWSIVWLMVTAAPMVNMALMTSFALIDILSASSATLMDSGIETSRTIGCVGFWKPCLPLPLWLAPPRRPPRRSARFTFLPPPRLRSSRSPRSSSSSRPFFFAAAFFGGAVRRSVRPSFGGAGGRSSATGVSSISSSGTSISGTSAALALAFSSASLRAASSAALAFAAAAFSSAARASRALRSASASAISPTN